MDSPEITIIERKPFWQVLLTPLGIILCVMAVLSFGITFFMLVWMHFRVSPKRLGFRDGRLFDGKKMPPEGVRLDRVELQKVIVRTYGVQVATAFRLYFPNARGRRKFLVLNRHYYRKPEFEEAIRTLESIIASVRVE